MALVAAKDCAPRILNAVAACNAMVHRRAWNNAILIRARSLMSEQHYTRRELLHGKVLFRAAQHVVGSVRRTVSARLGPALNQVANPNTSSQSTSATPAGIIVQQQSESPSPQAIARRKHLPLLRHHAQ